MALTKPDRSVLDSASKTLLSFADDFLSASDRTILDAGCGFGRNALALAMRGASVVCLDHDSDRLRALMSHAPKLMAGSKNPQLQSGRLYPVCADVDLWPFPKECFSTILCVHLVKRKLFEPFRNSLVPHGFLYLETFGGQGRNYIDLPKSREFHNLLSEQFDIVFYRERKVGPPECDAVSVALLGRKR
jgi:SAM-dependent methyltransferase